MILKLKSTIFLIPILLCFGCNIIGGKSYEEAGTDFTKSFNSERKKMSLPIIPDNWTNTNPLDSKIQIWVNPIRELPNHSEKMVFATYETAEFESEMDRYNLRKLDSKLYQVLIEYSKTENKWSCSLNESIRLEEMGKEKGPRYSTTVLAELTLEEANDTLKKYGINRLNY